MAAIVQTATAGVSVGANLTRAISFTSLPQVGNVAVLIVTYYTNGPYVASVADSHGNTWPATAVVAYQAGAGGAFNEIWACPITLAGGSPATFTVTVTVSATCTISIGLLEVSGINATADDTQAVSAYSTNAQTGAMAPTAGSGIYFCSVSMGTEAKATATNDEGTAAYSYPAGYPNLLVSYLTGSGSQDLGWTWTASGNTWWSCVGAVFADVAAAPPPGPGSLSVGITL